MRWKLLNRRRFEEIAQEQPIRAALCSITETQRNVPRVFLDDPTWSSGIPADSYLLLAGLRTTRLWHLKLFWFRYSRQSETSPLETDNPGNRLRAAVIPILSLLV